MLLAARANGVGESSDVAAAFRAETRTLVATRFPVAAGIFLLLMAIGYGIEWLYVPDHGWSLVACYGGFVAIVGVGMLALRAWPAWSTGIALLASVTLSFVMAIYLALEQGSGELTLLAMIGFLTGVVVQFPWGARGQLGATVGALVAYLWALHLGAVITLPAPYGLFALSSHAVMTILGAQLLDSYRFTAFREAAEAARHAAESQRANAAKSEFLATVSHELRTPLNIIVGYTDLMLEGTFQREDERLDALARIQRQSRQLLELIQSMLDLNRMEAVGIALTVEEFAVGSVLDGVRAALPPSWIKNGVELRWQAADVAATMRSDRGKVETVLRNLIHNACKYTERGVVTVSAAVDRSRERVEFAVEDTGQGIDPGDLSAIFEMFRQGSSGPPRGGGVGLGLYIVRQLTHALGGLIDVSSVLGRGARFTVSLPLRLPDGLHGSAVAGANAL